MAGEIFVFDTYVTYLLGDFDFSAKMRIWNYKKIMLMLRLIIIKLLGPEYESQN